MASVVFLLSLAFLALGTAVWFFRRQCKFPSGNRRKSLWSRSLLEGGQMIESPFEEDFDSTPEEETYVQTEIDIPSEPERSASAEDFGAMIPLSYEISERAASPIEEEPVRFIPKPKPKAEIPAKEKETDTAPESIVTAPDTPVTMPSPENEKLEELESICPEEESASAEAPTETALPVAPPVFSLPPAAPLAANSKPVEEVLEELEAIEAEAPPISSEDETSAVAAEEAEEATIPEEPAPAAPPARPFDPEICLRLDDLHQHMDGLDAVVAALEAQIAGMDAVADSPSIDARGSEDSDTSGVLVPFPTAEERARLEVSPGESKGEDASVSAAARRQA